MRRIDSHQHFWRPARGDYEWLTPALASLYRDFLPADLAPLLAVNGIAATILVQAAQTEAETHFLLDIAATTPFVAGVVGWTDMAAADAPARIEALAKDPRLKGLRPMLQDLPDDDFILSPQVQPALAAMQHHGLRLDALVRPRHLAHLRVLRDRFPDLPIVVDHGAKPDIASGAHTDWARNLAAVAADGISCCKLSGLATEAGANWSVARLRPFVETIIEVFGPHRTMWGSDWPVLTLASGYDDWMAATDTLLAGLDAADRAAVMGGTAARFYGLEGA
jgi:L-fuconolactonase